LKHDEQELREVSAGEVRIPINVQIIGVGEFTAQLHLYVDDSGMREIVFTIHGTAAAGK
jgi:hypothetical protein